MNKVDDEIETLKQILTTLQSKAPDVRARICDCMARWVAALNETPRQRIVRLRAEEKSLMSRVDSIQLEIQRLTDTLPTPAQKKGE